MLFFAVLALMGFACAAAFRWPVMLLIAIGVFACAFAANLKNGFGDAALVAVGSLATLQVSYVVAGLVLSIRLRRLQAKKNLNA